MNKMDEAPQKILEAMYRIKRFCRRNNHHLTKCKECPLRGKDDENYSKHGYRNCTLTSLDEPRDWPVHGDLFYIYNKYHHEGFDTIEVVQESEEGDQQ